MSKSKHKIEDPMKRMRELEERLVTIEKKATERDEYHDKYMRVLAEYGNVRKRMEKDKMEIIKFSHGQILLQLLPIIDDFDRAHDAAKQHKHGEVFSKGVEMILNQLHKLLKDNGVEKIKTVGEKFDPHVHEGLLSVDTNDHPEDTVIEEISPGYTLNGKLLRAAKVKISKHKKEQIKEGDDRNG